MKTINVIEYSSTIDGYIGDICAEIYFLFLKDNKEAHYNFQIFLENWFDVDSDKSISAKNYYSEKDYQECFTDIDSVITRLLSNLVEKNHPVEVFYSNLWDSINNDILFGSDLEKICAILFVLVSSQIPYFQMGQALRMSNDDYRSISQTVDHQYKKAIFALNRGYEQRTEVASLIVEFFKEIPDEKQQIVYIARLLGHFQDETRRLEKKIQDLLSDINTLED